MRGVGRREGQGTNPRTSHLQLTDYTGREGEAGQNGTRTEIEAATSHGTTLTKGSLGFFVKSKCSRASPSPLALLAQLGVGRESAPPSLLLSLWAQVLHPARPLRAREGAGLECVELLGGKGYQGPPSDTPLQASFRVLTGKDGMVTMVTGFRTVWPTSWG